MTGKLKSFERELGPMARLAAPIVLAELGWMAMGIVDTMMVGRLPDSATSIGGVSLGSILFHAVAIFGSGFLLGLDTLVSQAFGAGEVEDCHHSLVHGIYLSLLIAPLLMGVIALGAPMLGRAAIHAAVLPVATSYLRVLNWSTFPLLLYFALRRYLQGMNLVRPVAFALVSANIVNALGNWALIYGHWGLPAMGTVGSAWATCVARVYMAAVLVGYSLWYDYREQTGLLRTPLIPDLAKFWRLIGLGFPAAMQFGFEVTVFAAATALISRLDPVSLAGHQIALNTVSFTYMVPLGISSAAAVRVGQALGRRDIRAASHSGWTAIALGAGFMSLAALAFFIFPRAIVRLYTPDVTVIRAGVVLLFVGAFFQLFDGIQAVATGALRGTGDTRTAMMSHLVAYWAIGLPLGYFLCFRRGWGAVGLWAGLCLALILIGLVLLFAWHRKVRVLARAPR